MCEFEEKRMDGDWGKSERERLEQYRQNGIRAFAAAEALKAIRNDEAYKTYHLNDCRRAWGNYDARCPRCLELKGGAPRRKGWTQ